MTANMNVRQSFFTALTDTKATDVEGVGTLRTLQNGDIYRWVKNDSTDAAKVGAPACFDISGHDDTALKNAVVTEDQATADAYVMGGVHVSAIPGGEYGWILVRGVYATCRWSDEATCTVGDVLIPNVSTDTAATDAAAKNYCFKIGSTRAQLIATTGTYADYTDIPHAIALDPTTTVSTGTDPSTDLVALIYGLL